MERRLGLVERRARRVPQEGAQHLRPGGQPRVRAGQLGQRLVNTVLKKTGRPSYVVFLLASIIGAACVAMTVTLIVKMAQGDYDANDVIEPNESVATHLFYLGTGFGCKGAPVAGSNVSASGSS